MSPSPGFEGALTLGGAADVARHANAPIVTVRYAGQRFRLLRRCPWIAEDKDIVGGESRAAGLRPRGERSNYGSR